jgi:hypothetical protein
LFLNVSLNIKIKVTKVDLVSDSLKEAGEAQMTIVVLAFPPKDSCRMRVNLESLKTKTKKLLKY